MTDFGATYFNLSNQDPYIQSVVRPGETLVKKMPFDYSVNVGTATAPLTLAGGARTGSITTFADSDFVATSLAGGVQISADADMKYNRNLTIQIQDTSNGKYFFSAPTVAALCLGGGGFPMKFAAPRVIRPNAVLLVTVTNRDTAQDYLTMFLTFAGSRLFYAS